MTQTPEPTDAEREHQIFAALHGVHWPYAVLSPGVIRDQIEFETDQPLTEHQKDQVVARFLEQANPHCASPIRQALDAFFDEFHYEVARIVEDVLDETGPAAAEADGE